MPKSAVILTDLQITYLIELFENDSINDKRIEIPLRFNIKFSSKYSYNCLQIIYKLYTAKNEFSTEQFKLYSYLLYDGTEYVELTNYNNDILGNYEIGKVLTFSKINCLDNFNGYDNFKKNKG